MKVNINLEFDTTNEEDQVVLESIIGGIKDGKNKLEEKVVVKRAKRSTKKAKPDAAPSPEPEVAQTPVAPPEPEPEIEVEPEPEPEIEVEPEPEIEAPEPKATESPEVRIDALRNSCANKVRTMARKQQRDEIVKLFTKLGIQKVSTATDAQIVSLAEELKDVAEE